MQTSVHSAQKMSFRRPVAWTARTNSVSSQELTVVRSSGGGSSGSSASSGPVFFGCPVFVVWGGCPLSDRTARPLRRDDFTAQQIGVHRSARRELRRLVVNQHERGVL